MPLQRSVSLSPIRSGPKHFIRRTFNVTDMAELHADLKAKGVRIVQEPETQPWGTYMMILDEDDNGLLLVEPSNSASPMLNRSSRGLCPFMERPSVLSILISVLFWNGMPTYVK